MFFSSPFVPGVSRLTPSVLEPYERSCPCGVRVLSMTSDPTSPPNLDSRCRGHITLSSNKPWTLHARDDRLAQCDLTGERYVAVRVVIVDRPVRSTDGLGGRSLGRYPRFSSRRTLRFFNESAASPILSTPMPGISRRRETVTATSSNWPVR